MPTVTRVTMRQELMDKLYGTEDILYSVTTSIPGATPTSFTDTALISTILSGNHLIGAWLYPNSVGDTNHALQARRITQYNPATGVITFDPGMIGTSIANVNYELHYAVHPERLNEALTWAITVGSNWGVASWTLATPADDDVDTVIIADKDIFKEGALYRVKQGLLRRATGDVKAELAAQVEEHKAAFDRGLVILGYRKPNMLGRPVSTQERLARV